MAQEHILRTLQRGDDLNETDRERWDKTEKNFDELYARPIAVEPEPVLITKGTFTAGAEATPVELQYDINIVNYSATGPKNSVVLPTVTDSDFGKTVLVRTSNVSAGYNIRVVGASGSVKIGSGDTNSSVTPYLIAQNATCKFIYMGADIWLAEDVQGEKTSINNFKPANNYNNFALHALNNAAAPLSASALNTAYPATTYPIGFMAICPTITLGYIKTGADTWVSVPVTVVS